MSARFGRIPLDRITIEWEDGHPINPRMLAGEVAALLRTLAPPDHPILETYASTILSAAPLGQAAITHGALADYFNSSSLGKPATTITTSTGPVPAAAVLIWRQWINTLAEEAAKRAALVAGFAIPANDNSSAAAVANGSPVARQLGQPPTPSGSEPGYLKIRQDQQRREGARSAAEQLEAERIARQRAELLASSKDAQLQQALGEVERLRRELSDTRRAKQKAEDDVIGMEEQLEAAMAFAECLRADNPVSPPEMRLAFQCWRDITCDGTHDPAGPGGRGVHGLVDDWLKDNGHKLNNEATERLKGMVSWRKRGSGAIRTR